MIDSWAPLVIESDNRPVGGNSIPGHHCSESHATRTRWPRSHPDILASVLSLLPTLRLAHANVNTDKALDLWNIPNYRCIWCFLVRADSLVTWWLWHARLSRRGLKQVFPPGRRQWKVSRQPAINRGSEAAMIAPLLTASHQHLPPEGWLTLWWRSEDTFTIPLLLTS